MSLEVAALNASSAAAVFWAENLMNSEAAIPQWPFPTVDAISVDSSGRALVAVTGP